MNKHAVAEQRGPAPHLHTIITARMPWTVGNRGKKKPAMLPMLPVCLPSKHMTEHKASMENIKMMDL